MIEKFIWFKIYIKVTVKARGLCYKKSSPGKTTEPIDIKQTEDEYKIKDF